MGKSKKSKQKTRRQPPDVADRPAKKWYDINFKVLLKFRREFKQRAARHNMSMVQLLYACYWHWVETYDPNMPEMPKLVENATTFTASQPTRQ